MKKKLKIFLVIIIFLGIIYGLLPYYIQPKIVFNKYVLKFIQENYENFEDVDYIDTFQCHSLEGVWFAHYIDNCYISKYNVITESNSFTIYVTNNKFSKVYVYVADSQLCISEAYDENEYSTMTNEYSGCVTRLK